MSEIDWSKAPEGATHYFVGSIYPFEKRVLDSWFYFATDTEQWVYMQCNGDDRLKNCKLKVIERPSSPAWSGEGLPPVGTNIEWFSPIYGWLGGRVVGHDGTVTVVVHNDGYTGCHPHEVRPIRTPEQIAAEERESHVMAMLNYDALGGTRRGLAEALYDAGYRKTEG